MAALATVDDVAALLGVLSEGLDETQADAMLDQASAAFRREAATDFESTQSTLILRVLGERVELPRRPVISVDDVKSVDDDGTTGSSMGGWSFDGIHTIRLGDIAWVINATTYSTETVEVTWTHGHATVPEDVRWTVAQMTARAISSPAPSPGVAGEQIGSYSYRVGGTSAAGAAGMTDDERAVARRYRAMTSTVTSIIT